MPFYQLICRECGHRFEQRASMAERDGIACPACGSKPVATDYSAGSASVQIKSGHDSGGCPHSGACGCHCAHRS